MREFVQSILAFLRLLHIDVYTIVKRHAEKRLWRRAISRDAPLRGDGLCVAVDIRAFDSLAQVGRDFIDMMARTSIPFSVLDLGTGCRDSGAFPDDEVRSYLDRARRHVGYRHVLSVVNKPLCKSPLVENAITPFWEFDSGLPASCPALFDGVSRLVVFSDFCREYFSRIAPKGVSVCKVRYPYSGTWHRERPREDVRAEYGIPQDAFTVFIHFNLGSSCERKNPQGALRAFAAAFEDEPRAHLVLKVAGGGPETPGYAELRESLRSFEGRVTLIDARLSHQEILDLIAASDVYLSLHRGEGFGIGMLEAMSVGTPVVCTNYGGNTDFCKPETAFLVGYKMVPNTSPDPIFRSVKEWPEPNESEAASHLKTLFENPDIVKAKAAAASAFIAEYFSVENFARDVSKFCC